MNEIDIWIEEEAARQMAIVRREDAAFAALPEKEKARIIKEGQELLEAFDEAAQSEEDEAEDN